MLLRLQIVDNVYGLPLHGTIDVATTSHMGLGDFDFAHPQKQLVLLLSDRKAHVMPRYAHDVLYADPKDRLAVVAYPHSLPGWLPCAAKPEKAEIAFDPAQVTVDLDYFDEEELTAFPGYFIVTADHLRPRFGVYVSEIRKVLAQTKPTWATMFCPDNGQQ